MRRFMRMEGMIFVGTDHGVYRSTDGGSTWSAPGNNFGGYYVTSLASIENLLFAGVASGGVYRSTDEGASWTACNNGLTDLWVRSLTSDGVHLFAGTRSGGVYLSEDQGLHWKAANGGITAKTVDEVSSQIEVYSLNANCYTLFAGVSGGGIFRGEINNMITEPPAGSRTTGGIVLAQNFPNPFNLATTIWYYVPAASDVKMRLYDILGREVRTLEESPHGMGWDSLTFDAEGLASGIYVYRLQAGDFIEAKRLLLLR